MNLARQIAHLPPTWDVARLLALDAGSEFATALRVAVLPQVVEIKAWTFDELDKAVHAIADLCGGDTRLIVLREDLGRWRQGMAIKHRGLDFERAIKKLFPPLSVRCYKVCPQEWQAAMLGKKLIAAMRAVDPDNATKLASIAAAKARGFTTDDHNQADAFNLLGYLDNTLAMHFQRTK